MLENHVQHQKAVQNQEEDPTNSLFSDRSISVSQANEQRALSDISNTMTMQVASAAAQHNRRPSCAEQALSAQETASSLIGVGTEPTMTMHMHDQEQANSCEGMEESKEGFRTIFSYKADEPMQNETRSSSDEPSGTQAQGTDVANQTWHENS